MDQLLSHAVLHRWFTSASVIRDSSEWVVGRYIGTDSEAKIMEAVEAVAPLIKEGLICTYDTEVFVPEGV